MVESENELIIVRSLTDSDLGLFAVHRPTIRSKQRAFNINADNAQRLLSKEIFESGGRRMPCCVFFGDIKIESERHIGKVGKNWRLGGDKIPGRDFTNLDSKDFALIRSVANNDGTSIITIILISKTQERQKHAEIVRLVELVMKRSMALFMEGSAGFPELAALFPVEKQSKPNKKKR